MLIFASHFNDCFPDFNEIFHQLQIDYKSINSARNLIEETQWGKMNFSRDYLIQKQE